MVAVDKQPRRRRLLATARTHQVMTCHEAIRLVFDRDSRPRSKAEVLAALDEHGLGGRWKPTTVGTVLIALCVDHTSAHHYPTYRRHAFLERVAGHRYQPWSEANDGPLPTHVQAMPPSRAHNDASRDVIPSDRIASRRFTVLATEPAVRLPTTPADPAHVEARAALIDRLVQAIHTDAYQPMYRGQPWGEVVRGWPERLRAYFWPTPSLGYTETAKAMERLFDRAGVLATRIEVGTTWSDEARAEALDLTTEMLEWGRVPQRTPVEVHAVEAVFRRAHGQRVSPTPPMNSGWTKVAALATAYLEGEQDRYPHVIWDSRVSASLITRLDRLMSEAGLGNPRDVFPGIGYVAGRGGTRKTDPLPARLHLRWPVGYGRWRTQDAGSQLVREIRDVLNGGPYSAMPLPNGGHGAWTIRGVESVLFMDGY